VFPTSSKEAVEVVGVTRLREVTAAIFLPVVAIGGINKDNVAEVVAAGAVSAAVISAVVSAVSPEEATRELMKIIEAKK
jgi:thiamine-phosphate pyrophosphorylase